MLLLIRPARFAYNPQTAITNTFQQEAAAEESIAQKAREEFDRFVTALHAQQIETLIIDDTPEPAKPDAVFPNNWISFHDRRSIVLWPMHAPNRRLERRDDIVKMLQERFSYPGLLDLSHYEKENRFLEGTGSLVIDHKHRLAYAALSPRTDPGLLRTACRHLNYKPVSFRTPAAIYHTNVLMALHEKLAVVCETCIDPRDVRMVFGMLEDTGHELLRISEKQMNSFAGNMLFVKNKNGEDCCILSAQAYASLENGQLQLLERHARPVFSDLGTIETRGGGSARCMLAEIR